ncbi:MAG: hypothetical protein KJP06_10090, partial [Deltaproteobacteria bacterium]|nr:hypothetical protein [Deltaproteobacteria bacterium]
HKEIRRRSDQKYFDKVHWNFPDNEKGDVLGIINDPLDDRKYYLMKFDHEKNDIYLFIDEKGVQILDD